MLVSSSRKKLILEEVAMAFAEHGVEALPDSKALLDLRLKYMSKRTTYRKVFKNWGSMLRVLEQRHPELMELARNKSKPAPKATPKPKAAAKPAAKSAVKKGK
jgi:hypothetical protein